MFQCMHLLLTLAIICAITCNVSQVDAAAPTDWASLSGRFVFCEEDAVVPKAAPIQVAKAVNCGKAPLVDESLVIHPKNRGIANVIVWAYRPDTNRVHPQYKKAAKAIRRLDNVNCRFQPHAIALRAGQTLQIGNLDKFGHNALVQFIKNRPINPIIPSGGVVDVQLDRTEMLPVKIGCSIHPWMQGVILVQDHPYMAITDENGKFELANLPAKQLTLKVWHERIGYVKTVQIDGREQTWKRGRYVVDLSDGKSETHEYVVSPKLFEDK